MKTKHRLALLLLCFGLQVDAFAAMWEVAEPGLAFPETFPAAASTKVNAALHRPDCKFLGGTAHEIGTILRYEGKTVPLNLFLEGLAACPGITVSLRFNNPENANYDWTVEQYDMEPNTLCVRVNLKSSHLKIEDLVVPDRKGPSLPEKK